MFDLLLSRARDEGIERIVYKLMPYIYFRGPAGEDEYALFRLGARLTRVDISTAIDLVRPLSFSALRTRGAKKAAKVGLVVRRSDDFASFHDIITQILNQKYDAIATHSEHELRLLASRFPDNIKLYGAFLADRMLAGVIIFDTDTVAHAQYIGASEEGRSVGALDLIFQNLISAEFSKKRYFDFGISTEDGGRFLNANLMAQKEGFGGRGVAHRFYEISL